MRYVFANAEKFTGVIDSACTPNPQVFMSVELQDCKDGVLLSTKRFTNTPCFPNADVALETVKKIIKDFPTAVYMSFRIYLPNQAE